MRFLFVDQILQRDARRITGVKHITPDDPFLCRMPNDERLCFIPSLIGETVGQLAAWLVMHEKNFQIRPVAGVVAEAVLYQAAYVGQTLVLECEIDALDDVAVQYHGHALVQGEKVFSVQGAIGPNLAMTDFIDQDLVRQQFQEIDRLVDVLPQYDSICLSNLAHLQEYPMQFDAITDCLPQESCRALKKISRSALYFADHFPRKPVLPLTVLLECKRRLAETFLTASAWQNQYRLKKMARIKMSEFVQPGDVLETELMIKKHSPEELVLHFKSFVAGKRVCVVDLVYQSEVSCVPIV